MTDSALAPGHTAAMSEPTASEPLGAPMIVRAARRWGRVRFRAAVILRRGDALAAKIDIGHPGTSRVLLGKGMRNVDGASAEVPDPTLLLLDHDGGLHLIRLAGKVLLGAREEVAAWAPGTVRVSDRQGRGEKWLRLVEISPAGEEPLTLVANGRSKRQRAALDLIERTCA